MRPIKINLGILQIIDKISNNQLDNTYTTLAYYKNKLITELDRIYMYEQMVAPMSELSQDAQKDIEKLDSAVKQLEDIMSKLETNEQLPPKIMFSDLTRRIRHINRKSLLK